MGAVWGRKFTLTIFGESHGVAIGGVIGGLPAGFKIDLNAVMVQMDRRKPGNTPLGTPRREDDQPEILSGLLNEITTGAPLAFIIKNSNTRSADYDRIKSICRPGHADYTAKIRYKGFQDQRGGGHFSGRLTACLTFAGALARQILAEKGIEIGGRITQIGPITDEKIDYINVPIKTLANLLSEGVDRLPVMNDQAAFEMKQLIEETRIKGDSVGGAVEVYAEGLSAGVGDPFFDSLESQLASLVFSVPAVKAVEFGLGMALVAKFGSEANDCYEKNIETQKIMMSTNNAGGILGGISNGMPLIMRVGFKPTPSISLPQKTLNMETNDMENLEIQGRHDPCVVVRALPVIESCLAMVLLDEYLLAEGYR